MRLSISSAVLLCSVIASPAAAVTITFEGASNAEYQAPITRSGFVIGNVAEDLQHFHEIDSTAFPGFVVSNGTGVLYNDRDSRIFLESATPGQTFELESYDASAVAGGGIEVGEGATQLKILGFLNGVQVAESIRNIGSSGYITATFFGDLNVAFDRIVFDGLGGGGGFQLDNLVITPRGTAVPEPGTWALMIAGFGAAGAAARRRRRSVTVSYG